jgi:hypothetical protein
MAVNLSDFEGAWVLEKRIIHGDGQKASFRGSARFIPDAKGLRYEERGLIRLNGHRPVSAQRSYLWRQGEAGRVAVHFDDGRPFHVIDPSLPNDTHHCAPDTYEVSYRFDIWPEWMATWQVRGPAKDYRMVATYRRPVPGD